MAVVIRLQGLPIVAGTMDIRHFFSGLTIPDGGVHIVGGEQGEAFIVFATDEDARLGMMRTGGNIKGSKVSLLLSSKTEMQNMIELSRRRFETANLDIPPANSNRSGPPPSSAMSGRPNIATTAPTFNSPAPSIVTAATSVHESSKNVPTFSTASMGTAPPNLGPTFCSPTFSTTMPSTATPMNTVPPPPIPPMSSMPTLPTMPSIPSMSVPPPVTTLPPVPPVPPIPPVAPVPPMAPIPPLSAMPPMNPPPVPPIPTGMNGSGTMMSMNSNLNPMFLGQMNPATPMQGPANPTTPLQMNSQNTIKPLLANPDDFYVCLHGLPFPPLETDVKEFFHGLRVDSVVMVKDHMGRLTGSGLVKFFTPQDSFEALKRNRLMLGQRFVEVTPATERQWVAAGGHIFLKQPMGHSGHTLPPPHVLSRTKSPGGQRRSRSRSPHEPSYCVYLKGLPFDIENKKIADFFKTIDIIEESIYIACGPNGKATGEGFAEFRNEADHKAALNRHKQYMGSRFIQVHPITKKSMLEKIDLIQKRQQNASYNDQKDLFLAMDLDRKVPKVHAHLWNLPFNVNKMDIIQFLSMEGIVVEERLIQILVDSNGQGLGQALIKLKSEEDAHKAERLHRKKMNGRDVFLHLISLEEKQEIEMNPPVQGKRGLKVLLPIYPPLTDVLGGGGDDRSFQSGSSKDANNGPPFNFPGNFNSSSSTYGPPHPPPGIGSGFGETRPLMSAIVSSSLSTSGIDTKGFGSGPSSVSGSSNFTSGPSFGSGHSTFVSGSLKFGSGSSNLPSKFGSGSSNVLSNFGNAPSNFGGGPPNTPKFGSGPPNAPSNFGSGPPNVPSNFGGPPSAPSNFGGGPPNSASNFGTGPPNAPSNFASGHPNAHSNFSGGPPTAPSNFGGGPPAAQSNFSGGPPNAASNFSGGPPNVPSNFGGGPPNAPSNFSSGPPNAPSNFGSGPPNAPSNFGSGPPNAPSNFGSGPPNAPSNFGSGPPNAASGFGSGPPNTPSNFAGGPPNAPSNFGSRPPNVPSNFGSTPPNAPSNFGSAPPSAPSNFGSGPPNTPSNFASGPSNAPSGFGSTPSSTQSNFGSGPSNAPSNFGSGSSNAPSTFGRGPSNSSSNFGSGPSNASSNFGSGPSSLSSNFGSGPSNFGSGPPNFGSGPPNFGNGPGNLNAPPSLSSGPPSLSSGPPSLSSGPALLNAPPSFGPGSQHVSGPPGFGAASGKPGPTVIKVQNMPFTVTVDEILDFFYGYQLIPGSVCLKYSEKGMSTGEAMVAFESRDEAMAAVVDLNDRPIGSRKVKLVLG